MRVPINQGRSTANAGGNLRWYAVPIFETDAQGRPVCVENCPQNVPTRNDRPRDDTNQNPVTPR